MFDYASTINPDLDPTALLQLQQTQLNFGQYETLLKMDKGNFRNFNEKTMHQILKNGKKGCKTHITNRFAESQVKTSGWEPGPVIKKDVK